MTGSPPPPGSTSFCAWLPTLDALCQDLARLVRGALENPSAPGPALDRQASRGLGDVTFGLDVPAEERIQTWHRELACHRPLSVMTEDVGWVHRVPDGTGGSRRTNGFEHGGPRIAFDPIDGTRNLMFDLRSAWTVVSFAGPGPAQPRFGDICGGLVSELPTTRESRRRVLSAEREGPCLLREFEVGGDRVQRERTLEVDLDDRPDNGYFPFFRYQPALRPAVAELEAAFLGRLVQCEGADESTLFDDQYITNAGQLVLLSLGTYRVIVDARPLIAARTGVHTTTAKPYDVAGAFVVAQAAGAVLSDPQGERLDFPIDCTTPLSFAGWANRATFERLHPHLLAALQATR